MKNNKWIGQVIRCIFIAITFFVLDFTLRFFTRWLGYYSIYELAPSLFTICWSVIFIVILSLMPHKIGRIVYAVLYGVWAIYAVIQYVYYLIFDKFFFLSDIQNASEGGNYLNYVGDILNTHFFFILLAFIGLGVTGFLLFPDFRLIGTRLIRNALRGTLLVIACTAMLFIPNGYEENEQALFFSSKYEYEQFSNSGFDMEITGLYHYVARDVWKHFLESKEDVHELYSQIDAFLNAKSTYSGDNRFSGVLQGKNLILVQMESIDDWIITEQTMPTVSRLMREGINFTNMYTCLYGSGWTFSTEFAFNTGIYQSTAGVAAYSMSQNAFPFSVANILNNQGYTSLSFHQNTGNFYSRSSIHPALGYERYTSTAAIVAPEFLSDSDVSMVEDDTVWNMITGSKPFLSFINTYGAHVPYSKDNPLVSWALTMYPEYDIADRDPELNAVYAKARTLDDMFAVLLKRLEEDGLLQNTVIIAYADHYCYGLNDKQIVHELSEANGSSILERTPAFIWYAGCESMEVNKVCQTIDWVPTIANLFGVDVTPYVLGNDIFDDTYEGYAIFPDGTWLTSEVYAINGIPQWNTGITDEEISKMNKFVEMFYNANEAILASDYYAQFKQ